MIVSAASVVLWLLTWPYHWTLRHYVLEPIQKIAATHRDEESLATVFALFKTCSLRQLDFVKVASTISAAASVGALSWPAPTREFWLAPACWYTSLLLAVFSLIQAAQQSAIWSVVMQESGPALEIQTANALGLVICTGQARPKTTHRAQKDDAESGGSEPNMVTRYRPSKKMVYIWQCPLMLMSWPWVLFGLATTCHVAAPLLNPPIIEGDKRVAIFYLSIGVCVAVNFAWCSYWTYRMASKAMDSSTKSES